MLATQIPKINPDEYSRCEETEQKTNRGKRLSPSQKTDAAIKGMVDRAIWNDDVLRAIEYDEIAVHVKHGVVYLSGHIVSTTSRSQIEKAIRVPKVAEINTPGGWMRPNSIYRRQNENPCDRIKLG